MDLKRGIDKGSAALTEELRKLSRACKDDKAIAQVGTISANSDSEIGDIIANDNVEGRAIVEIGPGDVGFVSSGCGTWTRL